MRWILAAIVLSSQVALARDLTLFRGLGVPPHRFRTTGGRGSALRNSTGGDTWFTEHLSTAKQFAGLGRQRYKTVIEVELPEGFYRGQPSHPYYNGDGIVNKKDVPDLAPYMKRIGLLHKRQIKWFSWDKAKAVGLLSPTADYDRLFAAP